MKNEYVLLDYASGTTDDKVLNGWLLTCDGYPSLAGTAFGEHVIDCAFGSHNQDETFTFSGNLYAQIDYAPHIANDKVIKGPMTITAMFPFLKRTVFERGAGAAFESSKTYEAYLFKDNQYAIINYNSSHLDHLQPITDGFPSLKIIIFASDFDAAFALHRTNEAYVFKGDSYARINFAPGNDYISGVVKYARSSPRFLQVKSMDLIFKVHSGHNHIALDNDDCDHDEL